VPWLTVLVPLAALAAEPAFRMEMHPVAGGAELLTVFSTVPEGAEIPLLSVLRDTLGDSDPDNDRLRQVWVLTSATPTLLQRAAAAVPFFYFRPHLGANAERTPGAVLDLGDASRGVWTTIAAQLAQVLAIDGNGPLIRASSRRYRANLADRRRIHLIEGLAVLSQLEDLPEVRTILSEPELLELQARLTLAGQTLGGLVTAEKLPEAYFRRREQTGVARGHNWELLRQRAEANGLYFEPLGLGNTATHALLWVAREDLGQARSFDPKFLNIADPYQDESLRKWTGFTVTRHYDALGREVPAGTPGAVPRELIPLALYAFDYPKVPLLLVDFRAHYAPKRREMLSRAAADTLTGVLGVTKWGDWPYLAGSWGFDFVRTRRGAASDRDRRLQAYSAVRRWLALDHGLDPALRTELQRRLEAMGVNPLEQSVFAEAEIALTQYDALLTYAGDPDGLPAQLQRDRDAEMTRFQHRPAARAGFALATWATLGIYRHREQPRGAEMLAALDRQRRAEREVRFLEAVVRSSPRPEVVWNMEEVKRSLDGLLATGLPGRSVKLVERILQQTTDAETRALCEQALESLKLAGE
jgi:hypothetical protein